MIKLRQMFYLIRLEMKKITRLKRFYIALFILLGFIGMIALAVWQKRHKIGGRGDIGATLRELLNATTFSQIILLPSSFIILPVLIGIFTTSSFAGEERLGLIRTVAIRPVSRAEIILARFFSFSIFSYFLLLLLMMVSFIAGGLMFGFDGEVFCFGFKEIGQKPFYVLEPLEGLLTLVRTYCFVGFALISIVAMFLMFAVIMRKQGNAIVAALGFYFVSFILFSMPMMEQIRPYLPVRYMMVWRFALGHNIDWARFLPDLTILGAYTAGYLLIAIMVFRKRSL